MHLQVLISLLGLCLHHTLATHLEKLQKPDHSAMWEQHRKVHEMWWETSYFQVIRMWNWYPDFIPFKRSNHVGKRQRNDLAFPQIHWLNSTTVHDSPVIDGRWQIANVSIPEDWLCIKLSEAKADDGSQKYACMPQAYFARWFEASLYQDSKLSTAAVVGLVFLLITILIVAGALSWKTRMVWLARKRAHRRRDDAQRASSNVPAPTRDEEMPERHALELRPAEGPFADPRPPGHST